MKRRRFMKGDAMAMKESNCPTLKLLNRGKVRDNYDLGDSMLLVATDRISAFDVVLPDPIPDKGKILTQLSEFWLVFLRNVIDNHLITADFESFPSQCRPYESQLTGRTMLVRKINILPIEAIVRGYLVGSGWKEYQRSGCVCGIKLPEGMVEAQQLPEPIFTPSTKAEQGQHDENISFEEMAGMIGLELAQKVRGVSILLYKTAAEHAKKRGIILADTKFEFGLEFGKLVLADEVLTPDSSRFWPADKYRPGSSPESFDKQFLRDYLVSIGWKKDDPPPQLPEWVIMQTRLKYLEALKRLMGPPC